MLYLVTSVFCINTVVSVRIDLSFANVTDFNYFVPMILR